MAQLPLKGKVWRTGEGFVISIPKLYIDNGWVKVGKKYKALLNTDTEEITGLFSNLVVTGTESFIKGGGFAEAALLVGV